MASTSGDVQAEPSPDKPKTDHTRGKNHHAGDIDSGSGSENGEKPVREKLKNTDLDEIMHESTTLNADGTPDALSDAVSEARAARKRSLEGKDAPEEPSTPSAIHTRKRSRDTSARETKSQPTRSDLTGEILEEEDGKVDSGENEYGEVAPSDGMNTPASSGDEVIQSPSINTRRPKKKRSRDDLGIQYESDREKKLATTAESRARRSSSEGPSDQADYEKFAEELKASRRKKEGERTAEDTMVTGAGPARTNGSPQKLNKKRSREVLDEEFEREQKKASSARHSRLRSLSAERSKDLAVGNEHAATAATQASGRKVTTDQAASPPKRRSEDPPQTSANAFASSGFASMASSASPFGTLSQGSTTADLNTGAKDGASGNLTSKSTSAFAGSGFASVTGTASPFGSNNVKQTTTGSSFGSFGQAASTPVSTFSSSPTAVSGAPSPFASGKVGGIGGFGSNTFGSGFGGGFGGTSKRSTFAAAVGDANLGGSASAKPFGAPEEVEADAEDESDSEEGSDAADPERPEESQPNDIEAQGPSENTASQTEQNRKFKIKDGECRKIINFASVLLIAHDANISC